MANLSIVGFVARRVGAKLPSSVDPDDVHGAGMMGLLDAAQKFDPARGIDFRTYAEVRVHGAILDYLRSLSWAPRGMHRRAKQVEAARATIEQKSYSRATVEELASELNVSVDQCHRLLMQIHSLDFCEADESLTTLDGGSSQALYDDCNPLAQLEWKAAVKLVWDAIETLPERQKLVLWLYYYEELTMKEVGAVLEVNEARVSQLHSKAIAKLRNAVNQRLFR
jgi:RNA polymerase sigma factor FliA